MSQRRAYYTPARAFWLCVAISRQDIRKGMSWKSPGIIIFVYLVAFSILRMSSQTECAGMVRQSRKRLLRKHGLLARLFGKGMGNCFPHK